VQVECTVRDLLGLILDAPEDSSDVAVRPELRGTLAR
jgi:hypothetical protein